MPESESILVSVVWDILELDADEETGELPAKVAERVRRLIRDYLEITDWPSSREPYQIADFVYWNCWSASRDAAERWLASLTAKEREGLMLGDVLGALQPGQEDQINQLADENERRGGE